MATTIGAYELATAGIDKLTYEPQRAVHFIFSCPELDELLPQGNERLRLSVDSSSIPFMHQEVMTIKRGGTEIHFAGSMQFDTHTVRIIDYIGLDSAGALVEWQKLSGDIKTQKIGLARDYKKTAYLTLYDPAFNVVRGWTLKGCWISSLKESDVNMESGGAAKMTIDAVITFDIAEPNDGVSESK